MPSNIVPPSPDELRTFILGKSDPARASEIESYLEEAPDCTSILEAAPEDELVRHLRGAGDLPNVEEAPPAPATLPSHAGPMADTARIVEPAAPVELGPEA